MVTALCQLVTFMVTAFVPVGDLYGHGLVPVGDHLDDLDNYNYNYNFNCQLKLQLQQCSGLYCVGT